MRSSVSGCDAGWPLAPARGIVSRSAAANTCKGRGRGPSGCLGCWQTKKFQRSIWSASGLGVTRRSHRRSFPTIAGTPDILMVSRLIASVYIYLHSKQQTPAHIRSVSRCSRRSLALHGLYGREPATSGHGRGSGAERREIAGRHSLGAMQPIREADLWAALYSVSSRPCTAAGGVVASTAVNASRIL